MKMSERNNWVDYVSEEESLRSEMSPCSFFSFSFFLTNESAELCGNSLGKRNGNN